jgi:hypothetical protein
MDRLHVFFYHEVGRDASFFAVPSERL